MTLDTSIFGESYLEALAARSGEPLLDDWAEKEARYALASVFELVKFHGSASWTVDTLPPVASQVLVEAAARLFMNLGGYSQERADAVSLTRLDEYAQGAYLTDDEIARLHRLSGRDVGRGALRSVPVARHTPVTRSEYGGGGLWFRPAAPWYSSSSPAVPYLPGDDLTPPTRNSAGAAYADRYMGEDC